VTRGSIRRIVGGASSPRAVSLYARAPGARPSGDVKVRATRKLNGGPDCSVAKRTRPVPAACKKTPHLDAVRCGATRRAWGIQRADCTTIVHAVTLSIGYWDNVGRQTGSRKAAPVAVMADERRLKTCLRLRRARRLEWEQRQVDRQEQRRRGDASYQSPGW
jgi:hypothetical protein